MGAPHLDIIDDPARARTALQPIRLRLLHLLERPQSAPQLAKAMGMPRQRVLYHLRTLEAQKLVEAHEHGKLDEVWGTGTAAVISPVGELAYQGRKMVINGGRIGPLTQRLYDAIVAIQYGKAPDPDGWTLTI